MTKYAIGVDIGTTSTKSVLFTKEGRIVSTHGVEYSPTPETAEQDPDLIFSAVIESIKRTLQKGMIPPEDLLCVSFSSAMHSLIAVDHNGRPLTQCITWADNRSSEWAKKIAEEMDGHSLYLRTCTPIHPIRH